MRNKILSFLLIATLFIAACGGDGGGGVIDTCEEDQTGNLTIENTTSGVDGVSLDILINGNFTGATIAPGGQHFEPELAVGQYEVSGVDPNNTVTFIKDINLLVCDDLVVSLGN